MSEAALGFNVPVTRPCLLSPVLEIGVTLSICLTPYLLWQDQTVVLGEALAPLSPLLSCNASLDCLLEFLENSSKSIWILEFNSRALFPSALEVLHAVCPHPNLHGISMQWSLNHYLLGEYDQCLYSPSSGNAHWECLILGVFECLLWSGCFRPMCYKVRPMIASWIDDWWRANPRDIYALQPEPSVSLCRHIPSRLILLSKPRLVTLQLSQ